MDKNFYPRKRLAAFAGLPAFFVFMLNDLKKPTGLQPSQQKRSPYYWLVLLGFVAHSAYELVFFYFGLYDLSIYNFFSMLVFGGTIWYFHHDGRREDLAVLVCFLEATVFATVSTLLAGWQWHFQDWMIAFSVFGLMVPWETRRYFYILAFCNVLIYVLLFVKMQLGTTPDDFQEGYTFFSLANITGFFFFLFFTAKVFGWSNMAELSLLRDQMVKMETIVRTDPLTGMMSRRHMEETLQNIADEFALLDRDFYVVFTDVDNFKRINDTYGHDVGDQALITIAKTLRNALPLDSAVGRWGGEEFVILLHNHTDNAYDGFDYARSMLEYARQKVQEVDFFHQGEKIPLTITMGGVNSRPFKTVPEMIAAADQQMYAGKQSGKNRVVLQKLA